MMEILIVFYVILGLLSFGVFCVECCTEIMTADDTIEKLLEFVFAVVCAVFLASIWPITMPAYAFIKMKD